MTRPPTDREKRLADALRDNLKRRKQAMRAALQPKDEKPDPAP